MPLKTTLAPNGAQSLQALRVETKDGAFPVPTIVGFFAAELFEDSFIPQHLFVLEIFLSVMINYTFLFYSEIQAKIFEVYFVNCHTGLMAVA